MVCKKTKRNMLGEEKKCIEDYIEKILRYSLILERRSAGQNMNCL